MVFRLLLYPFSVLYNGITWLRNRVYDSGVKKSILFDLSVISVGNLTVGGTGKTPHIEYLIRLLKDEYKLATLSRGYGRKTRGFVAANGESTAEQMGDEPLQFFQKFGEEVMVTVCEERIFGIPNILMQGPDTQVILLDDAFQHRQVQPSINLMLTDYRRPFYSDLLLPAGRLRERRGAAARADAIVVSKCPEVLSEQERTAIKKNIMRYAGAQMPIFFSGIRYGTPRSLNGNPAITPKRAFLVSGIAQPKLLEQDMKAHFEICGSLHFADHHDYSIASLQKIKDRWQALGQKDCMLLTTEKDAVKLASAEKMAFLEGIPIFLLPIEVVFWGEDAARFDTFIRELVKEQVPERIEEEREKEE